MIRSVSFLLPSLKRRKTRTKNLKTLDRGKLIRVAAMVPPSTIINASTLRKTLYPPPIATANMIRAEPEMIPMIVDTKTSRGAGAFRTPPEGDK